MIRFRQYDCLTLFRIFLFLFIVWLFFGPSSRLYAFSDEFSSSLDANKWDVYENGGEITINAGVLRLYKSGESNTFPYVSSTDEFDFPVGHKLLIRYRILDPYNYGAGIVFRGSQLANGQTTETYHIDTYMHVWPQDQLGNIGILSIRLCGQDELDCSREYKPYKSWVIDDEWRELIIEHNSLGIYVVYDGDELLFVSRPISPVIGNVFFGNPEITPQARNIFPTIEIDYIRVEPIEIEEERDKIILIPGMFASWNYPAILNGQPGESWMIPEWIKTYNNVIASLENEGYILNEDLFVFPYDWRKKLFDLSDDLNDYMNDLKTQGKLEDGEQVDLVGHSFGGLVARAYESEYGDSLIDQIIAIGTPNLGVTQAYGAWEGLQTWNASWWQSQMIQLLVRFNQDLGELPIETLRRMSPSIQDVLPTYNFLNKNGANVSINEMNQRNTNLPDINEGDYEVEVIAGKGEETIDQLNIKQRSKIEELLGLWEDGKPIEKLMSDGDGTVLLSSAKADFDDNSEIEANHGEIVFGEEGITTLFGRLGLDETSVVVNETADEHDSALVAVLRSPGVIKLLDSSGNEIDSIIDDNGKILWLPGVADGRYKMKVIADGETGDYELHFGYIQQEKADWEVFFGRLSKKDDEDEVVFDIHRDQVKIVSRNERPGGSNAVKYSIDGLIGRLSKTEKAKEQLRILRQIKFWSHRLYAQYTREGNQEDADMVMGLLDEYDLWSEEIIKESGYEIKKQQVIGRRRLVINLEKTISRWKWYTRDLSKAREKLQIAEDYYKNKKYALADEYYYSAWLHLSRVF